MTPQAGRTLNALLFGAFMVSMDRTIVSIALPTIVQELQATISYAWIASAYMFAGALALPVAGRLLDLMDGRRLMLGSIALFLLGSVLCGFSPNLEALVLARFIQGLGGGSFLAIAAGLVGLLFDPKDRGHAVGKLGMVLAVSSVVAPVLGGVLTDHLSWRWIFFINLPTGGLVYWVLGKALPGLEPASKERMDWWGFLALTAWSIPLLAMAADSDLTHLNLAKLAPMLVGITVAFALFLWIEKRSAQPLFPLGLFGNSVFRFSVPAMGAIGAASAATAMYLPLFLVQVLGLSTLRAGYTLTALVLGIMLGSMLLGRLTSWLGRTQPVLLLGTLLVALSVAHLASRLSLHLNAWELAAHLWVAGLGLGMSTSGFPLAAQNAAPPERMGTATSAIQFSKSMGAAVGTAVLGTVLTVTLHQAFPGQLRQHLTADGMPGQPTLFEEPAKIQAQFDLKLQQTRQLLTRCRGGDAQACQQLQQEPMLRGMDLSKETEVEAFLKQRSQVLAEGLKQSAQEAFVVAIQRVFYGCAGLALLAFGLTLLMREPRALKENRPR